VPAAALKNLGMGLGPRTWTKPPGQIYVVQLDDGTSAPLSLQRLTRVLNRARLRLPHECAAHAVDDVHPTHAGALPPRQGLRTY
jgi:hypothetical protein